MSPRNAVTILVDTMENPGKPGAVQMVRHPDTNDVVGFNHACPCGCGLWSFIRLNPAGWAPGSVPIWERAGPDEAMTLSPSIGIRGPGYKEGGPYHWHGYLRAGVFEEC